MYRVSGTIATGTNLKGVTSTTSVNVVKVDNQDSTTTKFDDNKVFETDGDAILDFSEFDPWTDNI